MESNILAIGRFKKEIAGYLSYEKEAYHNVSDLYPVVSNLFYCVTSGMVEELSSILGVEIWDFSTHKIEIQNVDFSRLKNFHDKNYTEESCDFECFKKLADAGFTFMFVPNG